MDWLNIHTSTLDSAEFIGADPTCRATWLCLLRYCCGQENGGRMIDCASWSDRRWQQLARVTKREVSASTDLWQWDGADLIIWAYPLDREQEIKAKRELARANGTRGGRPRIGSANNREITNEKPTSVISGKPTSVISGKAEREREREREVEREGNCGVSTETIYAAYPLKVGKADALKAITRTLKAGAIAPAELLAKVKAYAAAVATWPEAERKYVPHPATWINRGSFDDDPATWTRNAPRQANGGFAGEVASVRPKGWGPELLDTARASGIAPDFKLSGMGEGEDSGSAKGVA